MKNLQITIDITSITLIPRRLKHVNKYKEAYHAVWWLGVTIGWNTVKNEFNFENKT